MKLRVFDRMSEKLASKMVQLFYELVMGSAMFIIMYCGEQRTYFSNLDYFLFMGIGEWYSWKSQGIL